MNTENLTLELAVDLVKTAENTNIGMKEMALGDGGTVTVVQKAFSKTQTKEILYLLARVVWVTIKRLSALSVD